MIKNSKNKTNILTNILGINIDNYNIAEIEDKFNEFLKDKKGHLITTPNAEIILASAGIFDPSER